MTTITPRKRVIITKVRGKPSSHIPVGYWVKGTERVGPKLGVRLHLVGPIFTSNGEQFDWFSLTETMAFDHKKITTKNSDWNYEEVTNG